MNKKLLLSLLAIIFSSSFLGYSQNITCGSNFYDPAGELANYANNANVTTTINPSTAGENVTVTFTAFQLESNFDFLKVYNGPTANSPLLANLSGSIIPNAITASNSSGCLTFVFTSDGSVSLTGWSAVVSCSTASVISCPTPIATTATTDTNGIVTFSWSEAGTASDWEVYVSQCGSTPTVTTQGVGTQSNPYLFQGLLPGTCYSIYVRSICGLNDVSEWSTGAVVTIPICQSPTQLNVTQLTSNSAYLNWTNPNINGASEVVYQLANSGIPQTNILYLSSTTLVASNLLPLTAYEFYVRSNCQNNTTSNWSGPFVFTTLSAPSVCGGNFYDNGGLSSNYTSLADSTTTICPSIPGDIVTVTFTSFDTETGWDGLYVYDGNSISAPQISSSNLGSNVPSGLPGSFWGTTIPGPFVSSSSTGCLTFRFRSDASVNRSGWVANISCDVLSNCPKPTSLIVTPTSFTTASASWNQQGTISQWEVQVVSNGITTSQITSANPYLLSNLVEGQVYVINVRGLCSQTEQSNWATYTITMPTCVTPTTINTTNATPNQVTINWNLAGNSTQYQVLVLPSGSPTPTATTLGISSITNSYVAQGLTSNTTYNFYVKSVCQFNTFSNWSSVLTFTTPQSLPALVSNTTLFSPQQLVNTVLANNPCVSITNVTTSTGTNFGSVNGIGYFTNTNPTFPMSSGMILSTGNAASANGPNTTTLSDGSTAWLGDADLESIITAATGQAMNSKNATKLEFDFTTINEFMSFNFLFASEEYGTFQCDFSDAFAFLLTDLITGVTTNIAVVPGTTMPISVVTIRDNQFNTACSSVNPGFFDVYNNGFASASNYNGQTTLMTASSALIPNHPYHIKLVVADRQDTAFDSSVFIEAGAFTSGPPQCNDKIQLVAFVDSNSNGTKDSGENDFSYGSFTIDQNNSGVVNNISSPVGTYVVFDTNPSNLYDFGYAINTEFLPYYSMPSINYNDVSIALGSGNQTFYFPITLIQGYNDVTVSITPIVPPRPGFTYTNKVVYKNLGINATSGTLTFVKDSNVSITDVSQAGVVSNASGFSYDFSALQPYETRFMYVTMSVPAIPTVNLDDVLTSSASISSPANDINVTNNSFSNSEIVVASYDPNDITESHGGKILHSQFTSNDYLYYTIRFQNTGTANAINVRLENLLDAQLNASSLRIVSASHDYILERINNHLVFKFDYINLVGALQNEMLSKGYVTYKIKVNPGFTVGDIIPNTAEIYFDTNPAIVTNTFNTEFVSALANANFNAGDFNLFPNPATNSVQIKLSNDNSSLKNIVIYDMIGKTIKSISNLNSNETVVDISNFSKGMYLVEITNDNLFKEVKKLIVE